MRSTPYLNQKLDALTDNDLRSMCPAIFAEAPREDVSSRYGFVSTAKMLGAMREAGFVPTQVSSYMRRDPSIVEFTKHMIRFRKAGDNVKRLLVGDVVGQVVLVNSHDRSAQFQLYGGLYRLICGNGMLAAEGQHVVPLTVRHTNSAIDGLLDAAGNIIKQQKFVFENVDVMRSTMLNEAQRLNFATRALALRPTRAGAIDPSQLLDSRRDEDKSDSLWHVFNRVHENMHKGGQRGVTANNRAIVTRGITAINGDIELDGKLWRIAMEAIEKARASSAAAAAAASKPASKRASRAATPANVPAAT